VNAGPRRVLGDLHRNWRAALALHAFLRLATAAVAIPLLTTAFRGLLAVSGDRVISNFDIAAFLLSPGGALLTAVAATLFVLFSLAELAGFTHLAAEAWAGRRPSFAAALEFLVRRHRALAVFAARLLGRVTLLLLPLVAAAGIAWFAWLGEHDINYYLAEQPPEWRRALWLAGLAGAASAIAIVRQLLRWLYVLPILAADPAATTGAALADSERLTHGRLWALLGPLAAWWLLVAACALVLIGIGVRTSAGLFDWAGMDIRRVLPVVGLCLSTSALAEFALTGIALTGQQFQLVRSYADAKGITRTGPPASSSAPRAGAIGFAGRAVAAVFAAAAVAAALSWLAIAGADLRPRVEVTAHRGASAVAPENSMAAFRAALDAGTDWIELDVQRLADGAVVVMHDRDFLRVGADPRAVRAVSSADLAGIDFGRRYGEAFAGEHPPLLAEVIALVRGRARLNVELKYNVPDPELAPAVAALLAREGFLGDSVITSLDYAALRQLKRVEPRLRTGHIITAAVGDVARTEADFLSLNAARATAALVRRAHRAGKPVHVWTVNTRGAMLELAARGVDNVITDDPAQFARVKAEAEALDPHELLGLRLRALFGHPPAELADPAAVLPL
jgi:glycerophosphoryl diester phosphodiesterase